MVDATTQTELEKPVVRWRILAYGDFTGDPLRGTTSLYNRTVSGSGDAELDGTYDAFNEEFIGLGAVGHNESGTDTLNVSLSGLVVNNAAFLNLIGDKSKWQGNIFRLWFFLVDEDEALVGAIIPYYTGYMNEIKISGSPEEQTVTLSVENYINTLSGSSSKTYLAQKEYDSNDESAAAAIAAANGLQGAGLSSYGSGGVFDPNTGFYLPGVFGGGYIT